MGSLKRLLSVPMRFAQQCAKLVSHGVSQSFKNDPETLLDRLKKKRVPLRLAAQALHNDLWGCTKVPDVFAD